ncbi:MAG: efflux RND transporter periplasmic adaptor subunit [Rhodobiaceae bacterium]|nr:efflux RND transporter periplasmic adaptor subunit [Rhodobiaceae bacterium]
MNSTTAALLAVVLLTLPKAALAENEPGGRPASLVQVDAVISEPFGQTAPVIGRLVSRQAGVVAARIAGAVAQMHVHVGDHVEEGDMMAELVSDSLEVEVRRMEAALQRAEAELAIRRNESERLRRLRNSAAFQQGQYEDKKLEVTTLESRVTEAKADLEIARLNLEYASIRAPYAGTVTLRQTEAGAYVPLGAPVVSLVNDQSLEAEADIPSDRMTGLRPGRKVTVEIAGVEAPASVRALVPVENPLTRTRAVRFTLEGDANAQFTPNQTAIIHIPVGDRREVVTVHKDAIVNRQGETIVFVVTNSTADMRAVQLGEPVGGRFIVLEGLAVGDSVAVRGNERLRSGQPVRVDEGA